MKTRIGIPLLAIFLFTALISLFPRCREVSEQQPPVGIHTPDSVEGNDSVPATILLSSDFKRVVIARLKHNTDILQGIKDAVEKEGIHNAVILSGIGSTCRHHIHSVDNCTFPARNVFYEQEMPMDILCMNGYIIEGRVHAHISLSNGAQAIGGHLEPGTRVFTFCIITLGILEDEPSLERVDDLTWR